MSRSAKISGGEYPAAPQAAVGAIVFRDDKLLLVKRANHPGKGLWAIPGGRVELGETMKEAAMREVKEETGVRVSPKEPIYVFEVIERDNDGGILFHYVIIDLLAEYLSGEPNPGTDAIEARWISSGEMKELQVTKTTREFLRSRFRFGL
jgi:8-oxo-dGTP diphosphatase